MLFKSVEGRSTIRDFWLVSCPSFTQYLYYPFRLCSYEDHLALLYISYGQCFGFRRRILRIRKVFGPPWLVSVIICTDQDLDPALDPNPSIEKKLFCDFLMDCYLLRLMYNVHRVSPNNKQKKFRKKTFCFCFGTLSWRPLMLKWAGSVSVFQCPDLRIRIRLKISRIGNCFGDCHFIVLSLMQGGILRQHWVRVGRDARESPRGIYCT